MSNHPAEFGVDMPLRPAVCAGSVRRRFEARSSCLSLSVCCFRLGTPSSNVCLGDFVTVGRDASHSWFDSGHTSSCVGSRIWGISTFCYVKVDLGSRGLCRVLFAPGNLDFTSTGPLYLASCVRLRWQLEEFLHFLREGVPILLCAIPGSIHVMRQLQAAWTICLYFLFVKENSNPEVDSCPVFLVVCVSRRMEKCAQTMLQFARVALEIWTSRLRALPI